MPSQIPASVSPRVALLMEGNRKYERGLLQGIADYSNLHGPWQFYRHVPYLPEGDASPLDQIQAWKPDALIIRETPHHYYDRFLEMSVPVVFVPTTEPRPGVSNIVTSDRAVGQMAADHLHENGFRSFAFCGMNALFFWSRLRCQGFREEVDRFGHKVDVFESPPGREFLNWNQNFDALTQWLGGLPTHTGVMVATDDFSHLVQEACLAAERSIPDDIALIGVGNDEAVCELATTPLTSIRLNTERAGYDAAQQLARRIRSSRASQACDEKNIIIEPLQVASRRSTDVTIASDPQVSRAITFIHERVNQPIDVKDVVSQVSLSRRALYDRFSAVTGQTISAYIRRRRLDHFTRLLLETNLTIAEIAYSMGYDTDANVARLFQRFYGMTPMSYRRKHARQGRGGEPS